MPRLTYRISSSGLAISAQVGLSGNVMAALNAARVNIPAPVQAKALIDTGSDVTAVSSAVLRQVGATPATSAYTHTAGGLVQVDLFELSVSILDTSLTPGNLLVFPNVVVSALQVELPDVDVLIGMNLLLECRFYLDGPGGAFWIEY